MGTWGLAGAVTAGRKNKREKGEHTNEHTCYNDHTPHAHTHRERDRQRERIQTSDTGEPRNSRHTKRTHKHTYGVQIERKRFMRGRNGNSAGRIGSIQRMKEKEREYEGNEEPGIRASRAT